ncbi:aminotransferase class I/II-fold pyridoxal phosphate-dependent enzyme [Neptunomonas sp.]|uniref:aminotransferase class I/II-fold pyridoxal phosphate-dependent enzyme n=1 Tax=Neptunomonas sp. TaxID=1971898 RepID=UPI0035637CFD
MISVTNIVISRDKSIRQCLEILDQTGMSILLLVNENGSLLRTITDGDMRRLILSGATLDDDLSGMPEKNPIRISQNMTDDQVLELMDLHQINQLPQVDVNNKPIGLHSRHMLRPRIQLSIPHMGEQELIYVKEAFDTNWIAPLGPNVDAFESELAEYVGSKHAAAVSSGTAAIHLALRLLNVGQGDYVLCSSFTFVASANPILYQGATPVFVDSEPDTWNMSPVALEHAILSCIGNGHKPKAILTVHLYGQSADMGEIMKIAEKYEIPVIEDAAESLGGRFQGQHTGTFGKFGVFSFNGNKIITTSGGGMLVSDDVELIEKARFLSTQARDPAPYYEHTEIGYNYRMSNVLAGIGRGQLKVLDDRVQARRDVFQRYRDGLKVFECLEWMPEPSGDVSNRWLTAVSIKPRYSVSAPDLIKALTSENIEARHLWKPMHRQPLFSGCLYFPHSPELSLSDYLFETGLCLPSGSNMTVLQQQRVIDQLGEVLNSGRWIK